MRTFYSLCFFNVLVKLITKSRDRNTKFDAFHEIVDTTRISILLLGCRIFEQYVVIQSLRRRDSTRGLIVTKERLRLLFLIIYNFRGFLTRERYVYDFYPIPSSYLSKIFFTTYSFIVRCGQINYISVSISVIFETSNTYIEFSRIVELIVSMII